MQMRNAIQVANDSGWLLKFEDSDTRKDGSKSPSSHVYAVRGTERVYLCSFSEMLRMSRANFSANLAQLPGKEVVAA